MQGISHILFQIDKTVAELYPFFKLDGSHLSLDRVFWLQQSTRILLLSTKVSA